MHMQTFVLCYQFTVIVLLTVMLYNASKIDGTFFKRDPCTFYCNTTFTDKLLEPFNGVYSW